VCLRVWDPDDVQEEHKRFILVQAEECPTSSGGRESCIILYQSACSRGYKRVREGGTPRSQDASGECVCSPLMSRTAYRFAFRLFFVVVLVEWSLPSPLIDARGTQGYMHVLHDIFPRKKDLRPPVVGGVSLFEEWTLSFDAIVTCPAIRSPMNDAATTRRVVIVPVATCLSFGLTGVEGRGLGGVNHGVILLCLRE
jgi:hypothetical protein